MINPGPKSLAWVAGAGGLIGNYLLQTAPAQAPDWRVIGLRRAQFDLTDFQAVRLALREQMPALVIHCAALSNSNACQANPTLARKLNVEVTAMLADLAADIPFIFFSTDLVFDGGSGNYDESAPVNPLMVYAETKVAAETIVLANPKHTVVRTSLNGGTSPAGNRSFNEQMRLAWHAGETLKLFADEFRCPIPAVVTARAVWELARQNRPGLYHVAGRERLSRIEIGQLMAARWPQLHPHLAPTSVKDYQDMPRAADTSLHCAKVQRLLPFPLAGLNEWLAENPSAEF